jgi:pyruvate-formate lyase-activating enzyme
MTATPPRSAATVAGPKDIVWDITYACPLRCTHCYSESGRRASRQLGYDDLLRVTDALLALNPLAIVLAGGEPLVVRHLREVIERITGAGVQVHLYTSGWAVTPAIVEDVLRLCTSVSVSVDGATAEVHDRIRGRAGSFDRAMNALGVLDEASRAGRLRGEALLCFGLDATIVRGSLDQLEEFCTSIAPRFPELGFLSFGAAMPIGLASRAGFVEHELLDDEQADRLVSPEMVCHLRSLVPPSLYVSATDNRLLQYHPDRVAAGTLPAMQVEPDGRVRAMAIYEGTVGSLLTEAPLTLWERSMARLTDPFVVQTLLPVRTMRQWAEATRRLDRHFGTDDDRHRIDRRPVYLPLTVSR